MLYFAYGMNTNSKFMSTKSKRLGVAVLPQYKWEMIQFANVYRDDHSYTIGILWDIDEDELARLDMREGYPTFYERLEADVEHQGEIKKAIVYYMTGEYRRDLKDFPPSTSYYEGVVEGFAEDGITIPSIASMGKRTLKDGTQVNELNSTVELVVRTKCPEKWLLIDRETGEQYVGQHGRFYDWRKIANE